MKKTCTFSLLLGALSFSAQAAVVQLTFEGLKNQEQVANYFNGGSGGGQYDETGAQYGSGGSTGGKNYGISFGGNSLAIIAEDAGGTGRFANNPSGSTVLSFNNQIKSNSIMNVSGGFTTGLAFWYSQPFYPTSVTIYDGLNGTGKVLATLNMAQSATNCPVDKTGNSVANCWTPVGIYFQGVAHSVDFSNANFTAFDEVTLGDVHATPIPPPFPAPTSCPIASGVSSFVLEHKIDAYAFTSIFIPNFAPAQLAVFFDPTKEIHTHFEFNAANMQVNAWSYALPLGGPAMAPAGLDFKTPAIATATINIDRIYYTCTPRPAIAITGYVAASTPVYGSMVGLPHWIAFSYDPSSTAGTLNASNITTVNAGTTTILGADGAVIVTPANGGSGTSGSTPVLVVNPQPTAAGTLQVFQNPFTIDGSKSMAATAANGPLTYQWSSNKPATFSPNATTPTPTITFQSGGGDYTITGVITDQLGNSASRSFVLEYLGH